MRSTDPASTDRTAYTIRVPTFVFGHEMGLGDILKRISTSLGVGPCARCDERAACLNSWLRFAPAERPRRDHG
jgi:hypothetical protein